MKITETQSGVVISTKQFIWCGNQRCEVRDASSNITNQYFSYGQVNYSGSTATNYYYTFEYFGDHLGSIRELVDTSGNIKAQYSYSPYGVATKVAGSTGIDSDFRYASYYYHAPSDLNLTMYRAYSPSLGRWLTRDPIGYAAGVNLYAYVGGEPVVGLDPLGLDLFVEGSYGLPEPAFHQSINVGDPNSNNYYSQSYGSEIFPNPFSGGVYQDSYIGNGAIERYARTTQEQDQQIINDLKSESLVKGVYDYNHNCRSYSNKKFDQFLKKYHLSESIPPPRAVKLWSYTGFIPYTTTTSAGRISTTQPILLPR